MDDQSDHNEMSGPDVLRRAFPGRTDEEVVPIGLVYAGMRWGRDYRFGEVPLDPTGQPLLKCPDADTCDFYLAWLADYLYTLEAEPNEEQRGLCAYVQRMTPEDAMLLLGLNGALYVFDALQMENGLEQDFTFEEWVEDMQLDFDEEADCDEADLRELYQQVAGEMEERERGCPDVCYYDVAYRVPLSVVLKRVPEKENRIQLLKTFYDEYHRVMSK